MGEAGKISDKEHEKGRRSQNKKRRPRHQKRAEASKRLLAEVRRE